MGWVQIRRRAEFSLWNGRKPTDSWSWDESPSVAPFVLQQWFCPLASLTGTLRQTSANPSNRLHWGSTPDPAVTRRVALFAKFRSHIAATSSAHLFYIPIAVTSADDAWFPWKGVHPYSETYSAPLRSGASSPTFLSRLSWWGIPSSFYSIFPVLQIDTK